MMNLGAVVAGILLALATPIRSAVAETAPLPPVSGGQPELYGERKLPAVHNGAYFGATLLYSSGYKKVQEAVNGGSGVGGWVGLEGGYRLALGPDFSLSAGVTAMGAIISDSEGKSGLDSVVLPVVGVRYGLLGDPASLYLGAEVSYNLPHSGSDLAKMESGGVGYNFVVGFGKGRNGIELMYCHIPVKVSGIGDFGEEEFGGIALAYRYSM